VANESRASYQEWRAIAVNRGRLLILSVAGIIGVLIWHEMHPVTVERIHVYEFTNGGTTFVKIAEDDGGVSLQQNEVLTEMFLRKYILDREPVDHINEEVRYPRVMALSSEEVGDAFASGYNCEDCLSNDPRFMRKVEIVRSGFLTDDIFQAELKITDAWDDKPEPPSFWVASLQFTREENKIRFDNRFQNPLGLDVIRYSLVERNETTKGEKP